LYVKKQRENDVLIVALYVDDLVIMRSNGRWIEDFKKLRMIRRYEMNDMRLLHHFFSIEVYKMI
jgi:hypothetical protein